MAALCDVNLLLFIATDRHPHHATAIEWLQSKAPGEARICRIAQLGFLRLLNNPAVMQEDVLNADDCWIVWTQLLSDETFHFVSTEPAGLDGVLRQLTASERYSPQLWTDAYLAAYACAARLTLVTFDRAFARFPGLKYEILQ